MRPPGVLVVLLALVCSVPAFVGASLGTMTAEDAVQRAVVLVLGAWALDLLLRPAALRIIHGPPAARADAPRGPEVPAHDGPTVPEVA
jgi:uncharacterized membrane protein YfcA